MTKKQWLTGNDLVPMLKFARGKASDRKLRLFACACCRRVWKSLTLKPVRRAVEMTELCADGTVTEQELDDAHRKAILACTGMLHRNVDKMAEPGYGLKMARMAHAVDIAHTAPVQVKMISRFGEDEALKELAPELLRCVVGNPFRPVAFDGRWRTSDVVELARTIYAERAFDRLPLLADALMDAGCGNTDIIDHCRSDGPHDRGCWVVDLALGKG
jgi:hypothetical protein